jgi:hypothetical protein
MNQEWYLYIGPQMVTTMLILVFMPYVSFCISITIRQAKMLLDSGWICCPRKKEIDEEMR